MKTPKELYYKAIKLKKRLSPEAEALILTDPEWSYYYALHVIKGRWPEAEKVIKKDKDCWIVYKNHFKVEFKIEEILNS